MLCHEPEIENWIYGIIDKMPYKAGGFLSTFAEAVIRADADNYEILKPAIEQLKAKYPKYGTATISR